MDSEKWFKDKLEQFKDDPEFIKEKIWIEIGELKAKARKWDRVLEMNDEMRSCAGCKYDNEGDCVCDDICCFNAVVDALEGEGEKS